MGPIRGRLTLALLAPSPAWAEVCDKARPGWDGVPVTAWQEALTLMTSPAALILLMLSLIALRFRSAWGALAVTVLWTGLVTLVSMVDISGLRDAAMTEGCIGSSALFIALIAAICVAMILYTAPLPKRS